MKVTATDQIVDEGQVFAEPGAVGEVLDFERRGADVLALSVAFPGAPRVTTAYLGENCDLVTVPAPSRR